MQCFAKSDRGAVRKENQDRAAGVCDLFDQRLDPLHDRAVAQGAMSLLVQPCL